MLATIILITIGALNPAVTQATIATTICSRGYTTSIRPPRAVMYRIKRRMMKAQHVTAARIADHIMPLELGGAPLHPANIQLQTPAASKRKDKVENELHAKVCAGTLTLSAAQSDKRLTASSTGR